MCKHCSGEFRKLNDVQVVIGINASVSIYRIPDLVRELINEGATVRCGMSDSAQKLVNKEIYRWASGNEVITEITGKVEHIALFSKPSETVLLLAPATYNLVGKIASGISDSVPSLLFTYAFGHGVKVIVAPAMHEDMLRNPIIVENMEKLASLGVKFVSPRIEDEKAKIPENDYLIDEVYRAIHGDILKDKRVLVISGRGEEPIDPVRVLSNKSTGTTGYWIARNLHRLGASHITLVGNSEMPLPRYVNHVRATETSEFYSKTKTELKEGKFDLVFVPAALTDFKILYSESKIKSESRLNLEFTPREKLLTQIRKEYSGKMISFKLDHKKPESLDASDFVVYNRLVAHGKNFGDEAVEYEILSSEGSSSLSAQNKEEATWKLLMHISGSRKDA